MMVARSADSMPVSEQWRVAEEFYLSAMAAEDRHFSASEADSLNAAEGERLLAIRSVAEEDLMKVPASGPLALARKVLVAFEGERGYRDDWVNIIVGDALAIDLHSVGTDEAAVQAFPAMRQLSFIGCQVDGRVSLWSPAEVAGDWGEQCRVGREYGREAVSYIRETHDAAMLPGVVRTINERGTFGGVEVGFFAAVSMSLAEGV